MMLNSWECRKCMGTAPPMLICNEATSYNLTDTDIGIVTDTHPSSKKITCACLICVACGHIEDVAIEGVGSLYDVGMSDYFIEDRGNLYILRRWTNDEMEHKEDD